MTNLRTSPYCPRSKGRLNRWFKTSERRVHSQHDAFSLRRGSRLVAKFVKHFNTVRSQSAIAYITPPDKLGGRADAIYAARRQKLATANTKREPKPRVEKSP
jgi:hypothetical protein